MPLQTTLSVDPPEFGPLAAVICGGRNGVLSRDAKWWLDSLNIGILYVGDAKGVDAAARRWAASRCIQTTVCRADWDGLGRSAGPIRNKHMAHQLVYHRCIGWRVACIAFPGGRGTASMVAAAAARGVPIVNASDHLGAQTAKELTNAGSVHVP